MIDFQYAAPKTIAEATQILAQFGDRARVLAGGTDLIVQLREGRAEADCVVDVKKIPELMAIEYSATEGLSIGASAPCYKIYENQSICTAYPALHDSAHIIGGWQIQSRASLGGNLCNASPAADATPTLAALGAKCVILGPSGRREAPVESFCLSPGKNCLTRGELLVQILIPAQGARSSSAYERFIPRNEMDIAEVGVGVAVTLDSAGANFAAARIALGAVGPTMVMATDAANWLIGKPANETSFAEAGAKAKATAKPITDMRGTVEHRLQLVGVLVKRTLAKAVERAKARK